MSDSRKVNPYLGPKEGKPLDEKLTRDELEAFYDALKDRDRAIVLSAIAENRSLAHRLRASVEAL